MSVRLHFVVEGQTEETFVRDVLSPHLATHSVWCAVRCVTTSRRRGKKYRGGLDSYLRAKNDLIRWMKEDSALEVWYTTMFDLYRLPSDFPNYQQASLLACSRQRVACLETAWKEDIPFPRFIPYIQLHEFEALVLADPEKLDWEFLEHEAAIANLVRLTKMFESPELINDGDDTSPSKRIIKEIPDYEGKKASAGPLVVAKIGLPQLRAKCPHFSEWLGKLERLVSGQGQPPPPQN